MGVGLIRLRPEPYEIYFPEVFPRGGEAIWLRGSFNSQLLMEVLGGEMKNLDIRID